MKKTVGIIGALAILLGCFVNLAFATDVNMIPYEGTAKMEKVEITSETSVRLAEDEMPFFSRESESVRLTDLESKVLKDTQLIVNDVLKGARATGSITWDIPAGATGQREGVRKHRGAGQWRRKTWRPGEKSQGQEV